MRIADIRATTVTVPLEAPSAMRTAAIGDGCAYIVEVETDNGIIGLGEMGGGGESAEAVFRSVKAYLQGQIQPSGRDAVPDRESYCFLVQQQNAGARGTRLCLPRYPGQAWNVPVCDILGGRLRDSVPFASYCFFRFANPKTGESEVRTIEQVISNARY